MAPPGVPKKNVNINESYKRLSNHDFSLQKFQVEVEPINHLKNTKKIPEAAQGWKKVFDR